MASQSWAIPFNKGIPLADDNVIAQAIRPSVVLSKDRQILLANPLGTDTSACMQNTPIGQIASPVSAEKQTIASLVSTPPPGF